MGKFSGTVCFLILLALVCTVSRATSQTTVGQKPADRIVIVKSSRTMTLESDGQPIKTYKVALGGQPIGAKRQQGDHKATTRRLKASISSTQRFLTASFTWHYTSLIQARKTGQEHENRASAPAATSKFMDWARNTAGLALGID